MKNHFEHAREYWKVAQKFPPNKEAVYPKHAIAHGFDEMAGLTVLEYGCGGGSDTESLARRGAKTYYADIVPSNVGVTMQRLKKTGLQAQGRVLVGSAELSFQDGFFDAITCHGVIHHIMDPLPVLRAFHRILKDGGKAYVMLYTEHLWNACQPRVKAIVEKEEILPEVAFGYMTDGRGCPWATSYNEEEARILFGEVGFDVVSHVEYGGPGNHFRTYKLVKS